MLMELARKKVVDFCKKMLWTGLTAGTFGNISIREDDLVAITPSGVDYEKMDKKDVVVVNLDDGKVVEGDLKPSSELKMHLAIYKKRSDLNAIVHTHSPYASAFAVLGQEIPVVLAETGSVVGGQVPVTPYCRPGSESLGLEAVKGLKERTGVLLKNHGVVAVGSDIEKAFMTAQIIEESARIYQLAAAMGKPQTLPQEEIKILREQFIQGYGQK